MKDVIAVQTYRRYQMRPLTEAEREYDDTLRAIDYAREQIKSMSMALLTVGEFEGFFFCLRSVNPTQKELDDELVRTAELLERLNVRQKDDFDSSLRAAVPPKDDAHPFTQADFESALKKASRKADTR